MKCPDTKVCEALLTAWKENKRMSALPAEALKYFSDNNIEVWSKTPVRAFIASKNIIANGHLWDGSYRAGMLAIQKYGFGDKRTKHKNTSHQIGS